MEKWLDQGDKRQIPASEPSKLDEFALHSQLKRWFTADAEHSSEWRREAWEAYEFVAGRQWSAEDKRILDEQRRPAIVFNRALSLIKAVAGIEINGRHEVIFLPRGMAPGAVKANELLNEASKWMGSGCDAEDEQSEAFGDTIVCGMGWTESRIDFEEDPDGVYREERIDPLEMYWDKGASAKNLADAKRIWRVRKFALDEAASRFPGYDASELDAAWARHELGEAPLKSAEDKRFRNRESSFGTDSEIDRDTEVTVVQVQWWERENYWRVADPQSKRPLDLSQADFDKVRKRALLMGVQIRAVQMVRRVYKQAFLGSVILGGVRDAPCADRFSINCITGERDRNQNIWFGLVRLMKDPQQWANKWLSQTLHILNATAKGGILAEEDAFTDQREAEETYALPDAITWVAPGAISKNKLTAKPGAGIPTAYINLIEFAVNSIRDVTGINLELLGQRDVNQPGVLEEKRKQAAMTILAGAFDALRKFRKSNGRVRLYFIQEYLSDGRIIRISGDSGFELVPLIRDKTFGRYDVVVDDAPTSPNKKEQTWGILLTVLPLFKEVLTPEAIVAVLEYSPLPTRLIEVFKELLSKGPDPMAVESQKAQLEAIKSAAAQQQADAQAKLARAQRDKVGAMVDMIKARQGDGKGIEVPQPPTELDRANARKADAQAILALAQAMAKSGEIAVNQASQELLAQEVQSHMTGGVTAIGEDYAVTPPQGGPRMQALPPPSAVQAPHPLAPLLGAISGGELNPELLNRLNAMPNRGLTGGM